MSQATASIANMSRTLYRAAVNSIVQAIQTKNSGLTEPTETWPYMEWADQTSGKIKRRNAANNAWITIMDLATGLVVGTDVQAYDANTAKLNILQSWTKAQRGSITALTDAATVAIDASLSNNFSLLTTSGIGSTRKLGNPTNLVAGQSGIIAVTTDAVSRLLTFDTYFKFAGGTAPVLSATSGAVDYFSYYVETSTRVFISQIKDVK